MNNIYLYGTNDVPLIPKEIVEGRILLLEENLRRIAKDNALSIEPYRTKKILDAIEFWKKMSNGEENHE